MKDSKTIINDYLKQSDWRVSENSNSPFSFGALNKYISSEVSKDYWLRHIYPDEIGKAYINNYIHIHDLGTLTAYCCGYSLRSILLKGVRGVPNIPISKPAQHFDSALNQISNLITVFQNEIAGAVALNSFDTLLAPFIKIDNLNYSEVKQSMQNFVYSINSNSRGGAEPAFSNLTFDLFPPDDLKNDKAIVGGKFVDFTYKDCKQEINMINRAFCEIMYEGDANGRGFAYPIPTYNVHKGFDWNHPNNEGLWKMAGKYGTPYFANYINSDMEPSDIRSMCCRLSISVKELKKRSGGLFGSGDATGAIGVVSINLPRIGYETKGNKKAFFVNLEHYMGLAKESLEIKRDWLEKNMLETKGIPAFCEYVGTLDNHFSVIGVVGMNEMCENFMDKNILDKDAKAFCIEVSDFIRNKLVEFQEETGHFYNYEATPAEGLCYRFALNDKKDYPNIITQGEGKNIYYTNSCHIPVHLIKGIKSTFDHQDDLQILFTGGTVIHIYENGAISGDLAKKIVKYVCENYRAPYISLSPINRYCDKHGYIAERVDNCPHCGGELEKYQRITGYIRNTKFFNAGKRGEFASRVQLEVTENEVKENN